MNRDADIFLWPDGFWCFRSEYREEMMRDENYRIIIEGASDWEKVRAKPAIPRSKT